MFKAFLFSVLVLFINSELFANNKLNNNFLNELNQYDSYKKLKEPNISQQLSLKQNSSKILSIIQQEAYIKASNSDRRDYFGTSVAISGNTMVVGAIGEDSRVIGVNGDEADNSLDLVGAAYVFVRENGDWVQQVYLKPSNRGKGYRFGHSVAISGDTIVIGARYEDGAGFGVNGIDNNNITPYSGAAYVFTRVNSEWSQEAFLKATNTGRGDEFGYSVSIFEDTIVVGSIGEDGSSQGVNGEQLDNSAEDSGAAYVYVRKNGEWASQGYLKASNTDRGDKFGYSVAVSGNTIVVGAPYESSASPGIEGDELNNSADNSGAAYVFIREGEEWTQEVYLKASNVFPYDFFGNAVSISNNTIVIGSKFKNKDVSSGGTNNDRFSGAVFVFQKDFENWTQNAYLKIPGLGLIDRFGSSVSISDDIIVVGSMHNANVFGAGYVNTLNDVGSAYVFKRNESDWILIKNINASNPQEIDGNGTNNEFGTSVAVSGSLIAVGASDEDSNARGVNGDGENILSKDSGAVYAYEILEYDELPFQAGLSALWYNPDQNGHGINVYMLAENRIIVIWYVYDNEGNQIWLLGVGTNDGTKATLDVTIHDGAMFPPDFDSNDVNTVSWGQFELEFINCNAGLFKWKPRVDNGFIAGEINVIRLTNSLGLSCSDAAIKVTEGKREEKSSLKASKFIMQAAHSAIWYNPEKSGHGLNVYMLADNRIIVIWYVYDDQGNQVWLLGVGTHDGTKATLDVNIASGAMFPPHFNAEDVDLETWGQFTLEFSDCNNGLFKWLPVAGNGYTEGETNVIRLNQTLGLTCIE